MPDLLASKSDLLAGPTHPAGPRIIRMRFTYNVETAIAVGDVVAFDFTKADMDLYGFMRCVVIAEVGANELACGVVTSLLGSSGAEEAWIEVQVGGEYGPVDCTSTTALHVPLAAVDAAGDVGIQTTSNIYPSFAFCTFADPGTAGGTHKIFGAIADDECVIYMPNIYNL